MMGNHEVVIIHPHQTADDPERGRALYVCDGIVFEVPLWCKEIVDADPTDRLRIADVLTFVSRVEKAIGSPYFKAGKTSREQASLVLMGLCAGGLDQPSESETSERSSLENHRDRLGRRMQISRRLPQRQREGTQSD